mmetsp:Transcript_27425/g.63743  ORF Transcript_27425/g.63743 Transcript_27425/m.63743 type:complete len:343 (+) Transcript_27425:1911-2939(+)
MQQLAVVVHRELVPLGNLARPERPPHLANSEAGVREAVAKRNRDAGVNIVALAHQVRPRVDRDLGVGDAADHLRQAHQRHVVLTVPVQELVAADDGHLHEEPRDQFANGRDFVEPVLACLARLVRHVRRLELLHPHLLLAGGGEALLLDAFEDEPAEGVEHLGDKHEQRGVELRRRRVAQELRALDGHLERLDALLVVPRADQLLVQLRHVRHVLARVVAHHAHLVLAAVVDRVHPRLKRVPPAARLSNLHGDKRRHLDRPRRCELLHDLRLAHHPRHIHRRRLSHGCALLILPRLVPTRRAAFPGWCLSAERSTARRSQWIGRCRERIRHGPGRRCARKRV